MSGRCPREWILPMDTSERNSVLVIGDFAIDPKPFTERSLSLYRVTIETAAEYYNLAKAVIVADFPGKFGLIKDCFTRIFPHAEDHGLAIAVIAHSLEDFGQIAAIKQLDKNSSAPTIIEVSELWRAAERVSKHRIGPSAGTVHIEPETLELDDDDNLLLASGLLRL